MDLPEAALQVTVLGSAAGSSASQVPDDRGGVRRPAALSITDPTTGRVLLLDPGATSLVLPDGAWTGSEVPAAEAPRRTVFLTHCGPGIVAGLIEMAWADEGQGLIAVHAPSAVLTCLMRSAALRGSGTLDRLETRPLTMDVPAEPMDGMRITPVALPEGAAAEPAVGYLVEGARRRLLYLPVLSERAALDASLLERGRGADVVLLDAGAFVDRPTALLEAWRAASEHARIRLVRVGPEHPALPPASAARTLLLELGCDLESDGNQYWL